MEDLALKRIILMRRKSDFSGGINQLFTDKSPRKDYSKSEKQSSSFISQESNYLSSPVENNSRNAILKLPSQKKNFFPFDSYFDCPKTCQSEKTNLDSKAHPTSSYQSRQRQIRVVILAKSTICRRYMHTAELLKFVHCYNREKHLEDTAHGSLKIRDLRQICSQSLGSQRPSIELRRNCILFNLASLRCVILHKMVILIPQISSKRYIQTKNATAHDDYVALEDENSTTDTEEVALIQKLTDICETDCTGLFEFAVLESLLIEVCSYLSDDLAPIISAESKLTTATEGRLSSVNHLREISTLKRRVDLLADKIKGVHGAIQELLNNEEDLRRVEISRFWHNPEEWDNPKDLPTAEDAEILLECYEQETESMLRHINRIDERLDDTLKMIQLHLASIRNAFLKSELGLDIIATVCTFVGAFAGIFGMNIPNGYESNKNVFWVFFNLMMGICATTALTTVLVFRRLKL